MENAGLQREMLESVFDTTDYGIMRHNVKGDKILHINRAALEILGYDSEEELIEAGFDLIADSVLEEDKDKLRTTIRKLQKVGESTNVDYRVRHKDGEIRNIAGRIKLLKMDGELIYQRVLLDCTVQKKKEEQERREKENKYREMINALSLDFSSVYFLNLDTAVGVPYRLNESMQKLYGVDAVCEREIPLKESMELYIQRDVLEEDREMFRQSTTQEVLLKELSEKKCYYFNYRTLRNGVMAYCQMKAVRVGEWDKEHNAVVGFHSVDEEIRNEMEQKSLLADALAQAERASKAKTIFLNNMSHDIRTPMNAIMGFTELARTHLDDKEVVRDYLEKILGSSNHLLSLINDILDMNRIESGKVELEEKECSLSEIVCDIQNMLQTDANAKQLEFWTDMTDVSHENVICDKLRLNQILLNCLSNAMKFTKAGGKISLQIMEKQGMHKDMASYEFKVKDSGIGMSREFMEHIFEPFERERTSTVSGIQGTGLGMAITKNIVDMMHGTIQVESEEGKGSEFTISLQLKISKKTHEAKAEKERKTERDEKSFAGKNILLVEDVALNREIAEVVLTEADFGVVCAEDGKEAVLKMEQAAEEEYDLILMDVQMPIMDGYEASRRIRSMKNQKKARIPILAMTANAFEEDRKRAFEAGMNGYLTKPIQIPALYQALKEHLK